VNLYRRAHEIFLSKLGAEHENTRYSAAAMEHAEAGSK
jgi:hypothetical protein